MSKIGEINWVTDRPKEPHEFGEVEVKWQMTTTSERFAVPWLELEKVIREKGKDLNE